MPAGALSHFGYAEESAAAQGTLVTITKFFDPTGADIDDQFPREAIATLRQDRVQSRSISKITEVKGSFKTPFYFNALPFFIKMALGACTTVADGTGYKHTFVGAKALPTFSAELGFYPSMAKQTSGCKVDKLGIAAKAGEVAEVTCDFLGLATTKNAPATAVLPADDNIATFSMATVTFDAVSNLEVMSMDLGIENSLEAIQTLNGTNFASRIAEGVRKITCGMEMDFLTQAMYDLSRAATKKAVVLAFTSTVLSGGAGKPYSATFTLPNVKFSNVSAPVEADGIISQKVEAIPMYDSTAGYDMQVVVTNTDTSYPTVP